MVEFRIISDVFLLVENYTVASDSLKARETFINTNNDLVLHQK